MQENKMRKMNSKSEFSSERSELLLNNFRKSIAIQSVISARKAFQDAANAPAPRFWVSEVRAARIIGMMKRGVDVTEWMIPEKREMYREIFRRYMELKMRHPEMSTGDLVFMVVNSEAPRSYLSWERARQLIAKAKKS